jgi:hypothetical protein
MKHPPPPFGRRPRRELSKDVLRATSLASAQDRSADSPLACGSTRRIRALVLAVAVAAASLVACARTATSDATSREAPQAVAAPASARTSDPAIAAASASQAPRAAATSRAAATPRATAIPSAGSVAAAPVPSPSAALAASRSDGPKIIAVATKPSIVHTGDAVAWSVRTSPDVVSVTAHVSVYTLPLQRRGSGNFYLAFTIPSTVPAVFHGTYTLELTARTQSGSSATRAVPMVFQ